VEKEGWEGLRHRPLPSSDGVKTQVYGAAGTGTGGGAVGVHGGAKQKIEAWGRQFQIVKK